MGLDTDDFRIFGQWKRETEDLGRSSLMSFPFLLFPNFFIPLRKITLASFGLMEISGSANGRVEPNPIQIH